MCQSLSEAAERLYISQPAISKSIKKLEALCEKCLWNPEQWRDDAWKVEADTSSEYVVIPGILQDAYKAGVEAEINNIAMYEAF